MKTKILSKVLGVLATISYMTVAAQNKMQLSIETDPSTFLFEGYSFHIRVQPPNCERFLIGAGTYGMNMPEAMVDLNKDNRDEGWDVRIQSAYSLFGEYYFNKANHRWFIGEQLGIQNFKASNDQEISGASAKFRNFLAMTYLGYSWHPYKGSFYIKPWAGLGYTTDISGSTQAGSMKYDVAPLFPFMTFHVGYTFR